MVLRSYRSFEWTWYFEIVYIPYIQSSADTMPLAVGVATTPTTNNLQILMGKYRKQLT